MATAKKKSKSGLLVWGLLVLIMLGLGGFGVQSFSGTVRSIGKVGDTDISVVTYANALRQEIAALSAQVGTQVTFAQAQAFGIDQTVRAQVVTGAALDNEAARLGVSVGDERVRAALLAVPQFRGLDGGFDREAYAETLRQNGLTEAAYEASVRDESARALLQGAVTGGIAAPEIYVDTIYAFVAEQRAFQMITLDVASLENPMGEPDEAQVKTYYDAHPEAFTQPEAKQITYVKLLPDMLLDKVKVDEQELQDLYQSRIAEFVQPERRLVERLVFATEEEATATLARISSGETTLEALVAERGIALSDIDLGDVAREDLGAAGDAVFALTEPGIVGPFASDLGPALFRMNAVIAAQEIPIEEARAGLVTDMAMDQARRLIAEQITDIDDRLAGGATLEDLDAETDMELGTLDYFAGSEDPIAAYADFRTAADALTAEDYPAVVELDDGGIVAMRLDAVKPPALIPLETVREDVIAAWTASETQARLNARAQEVVAALGSGATAESLSLTAEAIAPMARDGFIDGAPEGLVAAVFQMAQGETRVIEDAGRVRVVTLTEISPADMTKPDPAAPQTDAMVLRQQIEASVAQSAAQDVFDLYAMALEAEAGIRLNESAINAVHAQFN